MRLVPNAGASALAITISCSMWAGCGGSPTSAEGGWANAVPELAALHVPTGIDLPEIGASELTLEQLLVYADAHAPAVRVARAQATVSGSDVIEAEIRVPENPELSFGVGGRTVSGTTGFEFEVAVEQRLEIAREPAFRLAAASRRQELAEALVDEVRWSVHVEVHRLFVDLLLVAERREQAMRFVEFSDALLDVAQRQVDAGESAPLILLLAQADLERTRDAVIEVEQAEAALRVRLAAVIGWPEPSVPDVVGSLPAVAASPEIALLEERMLSRHPAMRSRELGIVSANARIELEEREGRVEPTLGLAYGREAALGAEPEVSVWTFSVGIPIPLWRSNQAGRARAEAELDVANIQREVAERALLGELHQAVVALDAAASRVAVYEAGVVPTLEENLQLLHRAYELGEVDIHVLSQTRQRLLEATGNFIDARVLYFETAAALEGLVGDNPWSFAEEIE